MISLYSCKKITTAALFISMFTLISCGGGGGGNGGTSTPTEKLTGVVSAPGGIIAMKQPTTLDILLAMIVGKNAVATVEGISAAGSEIVELIRVDDSGTQQGAVIASGTTAADGSFSIDLPNDFVLEANMMLRAGGQLDARLHTIKGVNVDPVTNAASQLIVDSNIDLSQLTVDEVAVINDAVESVAQNVEGLSGGIDDYTNALKTEAANDISTIAIVNNTDSAGSICGTVTDSSGNVLENITIIAKTFINPVTVSKIKTQADGSYCLNVEDGQYILAAYNFTETSTAASEWYTANSPTTTGGTSQFDAEPVTVSGTTPTTADFQLQPGARISGNVLAAAGGALVEGAPIEGVHVQFRKYSNKIPMVSARVNADGSYIANVPAGEYLLHARNKTRFPYASQVYDNASGGPTWSTSQPVIVSTGDDVAIDFNLRPGVKISGTLTDAPVLSGGVPVSGLRVRVDMKTAPGGAAARLRTNKQGQYRIWLEGGTNGYRVVSRGQRNDADANPLTSNTIIDFDEEMIRVTANVTLGPSGSPVPEVKTTINDMSSNQFSQEIANANGDVEMYVPIAGCADCRLRARLDAGQFIASENYLNKFDGTYTPVVIGAGTRNLVVDLGNWPLIAAGKLQGTAYTDATQTTPEANVGVDALKDTGELFQVGTGADGTYTLTLPPGIYTVTIKHAGDIIGYNSAVSITANTITVADSNP